MGRVMQRIQWTWLTTLTRAEQKTTGHDESISRKAIDAVQVE